MGAFYNLKPEDLQTVVATFRSVFPNMTIWGTVSGDLLLLGRPEPAPLDMDRLKARYEARPEIRPDLYRAGIVGWAGVLGYFMLGEQDAARFSSGARLNTDDGLSLEFSAPRALYVETSERNRDLLRAFKREEFPAMKGGTAELDQADARAAIGIALLHRHEVEDALEQFHHALRRSPDHGIALIGSAQAHLLIGNLTKTVDLTRQVLDRNPANIDALFLAAQASEALNHREEAIELVEKAITLQPENLQLQVALERLRQRIR